MRPVKWRRLIVAALTVLLCVVLLARAWSLWESSRSDEVIITEYMNEYAPIEYHYCLAGRGDWSPASEDFSCTRGGSVLIRVGTRQYDDLWHCLEKARPRLRDIGMRTGMWPRLTEPRPGVSLLVQQGPTGPTYVAVYKYGCVGISKPDGRWRECEEACRLFYALRLMIPPDESAEPQAKGGRQSGCESSAEAMAAASPSASSTWAESPFGGTRGASRSRW